MRRANAFRWFHPACWAAGSRSPSTRPAGSTASVPPFWTRPHEASLRWHHYVVLEDVDAHRGSTDGGKMTLVDDENVAFECIGEKLRQLGLVTESAADVERSLLGTDTRFDDHPVGEEHSLDDSPGGSGCRGVGDGSEQRRS